MQLTILECDEAAKDIEADDEVSIDFSTGVITNITKNRTYQAQAFPEFIQKIMQQDGLVNYTKAQIESK